MSSSKTSSLFRIMIFAFFYQKSKKVFSVAFHLRWIVWMVLFDNSSYFSCREFQQQFQQYWHPLGCPRFFVFKGKIWSKLGISVTLKLLMIPGEINTPNICKEFLLQWIISRKPFCVERKLIICWQCMEFKICTAC